MLKLKWCVTSALRVGKQVQGVSVLIDKRNIIQNKKTRTTHRHDTGTETVTPGDRTKASEKYREGKSGK
jgi:hypothetical protein